MSKGSGGNSSGLGWAAAGLAGLGALGSMLSVNSANEDAKKIARENRAWMEKMSNTAHQREVEDLRAAGLNPILSAQNGSGASTPSASTSADVKTPDFTALTGLAGQIAQIQKTQAETKNIENSTALLKMDKALKTHDSAMRAIDAKYHEDKTRIGLSNAESNALRSQLDLDVATSRALFDLSDIGLDLYSAKSISDAYPGQLKGSFDFSKVMTAHPVGQALRMLKFAKGMDLSGEMPAATVARLLYGSRLNSDKAEMIRMRYGNSSAVSHPNRFYDGQGYYVPRLSYPHRSSGSIRVKSIR